MSDQISVTFPDGNVRQFPAETTGRDIAEGISKSLAKRTVAYAYDGELRDFAEPIGADGAIEFIARTDDRALELIRHDCAHIMAEAVQE
ncbi:MAG: TGS domain-containing protein, partial [Rhizobiaceae bacterium]|nr:TGS domain-containing protein [Rhizobiaceae bacterium]